MTETKMISEREAVKRERAAFRAGAMYQEVSHRGSARCYVSVDLGEAKSESEKRYPLPKITRPRVVCDPHNEEWDWKCEGGNLVAKLREPYGLWISPGKNGCGMFGLTPERVELWAALFASPTEEVEDCSDV